MLFYLYIAIVVVLAAVILGELFEEKNWRQQLAMVMVLIPLLLRICQIK
jgi:hypothetical protein